MKAALKNLSKDTFAYGLTDMIAKIIGFVLLPIYTVYLSQEDYGIISMLSFIQLFFIPIASCGMSNAVFRRFNLFKEEDMQIKVLSTGALFVATSSAILFLTGIAISEPLTKFLVDDVACIKLTYFALILSFMFSISSLLSVTLRARRKVKEIAIARLTELICSVGISIVLVVQLDYGVQGVFIGQIIGAFIGMSIQYMYCNDLLKFTFEYQEFKNMFSYGIPYLPHRLIGIGILFYTQYLIKESFGLSANGLYNIATKFALPLVFIVNAVQKAWVPLKFQIHKEEKNPAGVFSNMISLYFLMMGLLFACCVFVLPDLMKIFVDEAFYDASALIPFALLIPLGTGFYYMFGTGFEFTNNTKPAPFISGAGFLFLLLGSYILGDNKSVVNIISLLFGSWILMGLCVRYFAKKRFLVEINKVFVGYYFSCILASLLVVKLTEGSTFWQRILVCGLSLFFTIMVSVIIFEKSDDFKGIRKNNYLLNSPLGKVVKMFSR